MSVLGGALLYTAGFLLGWFVHRWASKPAVDQWMRARPSGHVHAFNPALPVEVTATEVYRTARCGAVIPDPSPHFPPQAARCPACLRTEVY